MQAQGDVGIFSRIVTGIFNGNLAERYLLGALTGDILIVRGLVAEIFQRQRIHVVAAAGAVKHVGFKHRVKRDALNREIVA